MEPHARQQLASNATALWYGKKPGLEPLVPESTHLKITLQAVMSASDSCCANSLGPARLQP